MANSTSKSEATSDAINENISGTEDVTIDKSEEEQKNPDESNEPNNGYEDDQTQEMKANPEKEALKNPAKTEGNIIKENNEYYQIQGGEKVKVAAEDVEGKGRYYVEGQGWYENVNGADTYIDENRVVDGKQWKIDKNGKDVYIGEVPEAFETLSKKQQDIVLKLASAESVAEKIEYVGAYLGKDWKDRIDVFWESQYSSAISKGMTPELAEMAADFTTGEVIVPVIGGIISKGGVVASDLGALEKNLGKVPKGQGKQSWEETAEYLSKNKVDVSAWNKGSFKSVEDSIARHFEKHGSEVGAENVEQYMRKANAFLLNLNGAKKYSVPGAVEGVTRYVKNGRYIDLTADRKIISFGIR